MKFDAMKSLETEVACPGEIEDYRRDVDFGPGSERATQTAVMGFLAESVRPRQTCRHVTCRG